MMSTTLTDRQPTDTGPGPASPREARRFSLEIYKKGQGYWTRVMSAVGFGTIVLMGAIWLGEQLKNIHIGKFPSLYIQAGVGLLVVIIFGAFGYYFIGVHPRVVDFLIATEGEMKKVNWSTRRELIGSTWVVIALTVILGLICFSFDYGFLTLFRWMNVLESTGN